MADRLQDAIRDARLRRTLEVWRRLAGRRIAPARREIDPLAFRFALGSLAVIEITQASGPAAYRYRLMGTRLATQDGLELTGKTLADHPDAGQRAHILALCDEAVRTRAPVYRESVRTDQGRANRYARLVLPLSDDGASVTGLLLARSLLGPA